MFACCGGLLLVLMVAVLLYLLADNDLVLLCWCLACCFVLFSWLFSLFVMCGCYLVAACVC